MEPAAEGAAVMKATGKNSKHSILGNHLITLFNKRKALSGMYLSFF